jgi:hypothetical protein
MIVHQRDKTSIRIYEDSRPHQYKSSYIQKGLILFYGSKAICGEGIGFGVPVVKYADKTYFPKNGKVFISRDSNSTKVVKVFEINGVFRIKLFGKHISSRSVYFFTELFSKTHRNHMCIRGVLDIFLQFLRKSMKRPADLVTTVSKGTITVTYRVYEGSILICVDSSNLDKTNCKEICIMNEQGADFFREYGDTDENLLTDDQISSWEEVKAREAWFSDLNHRVSFALLNMSGANLYRGREKFDGHLAWTVFSYSIPPTADRFEYRLNLHIR